MFLKRTVRCCCLQQQESGFFYYYLLPPPPQVFLYLLFVNREEKGLVSVGLQKVNVKAACMRESSQGTASCEWMKKC